MDPEQFDHLLDKVEKFTHTEDVCLAVWLEAVLRGQFTVAREILRTGLLLEHFQSVMPENPAEVPSEMLVAEAKFQALFDRALAKFDEASKPREPEEGVERERGDRRERYIEPGPGAREIERREITDAIVRTRRDGS